MPLCTEGEERGKEEHIHANSTGMGECVRATRVFELGPCTFQVLERRRLKTTRGFSGLSTSLSVCASDGRS